MSYLASLVVIFITLINGSILPVKITSFLVNSPIEVNPSTVLNLQRKLSQFPA